MLVSPNMVTSNSSVSLLESLHLHRLTSHQEQKMIFKTETNSSLEIIRFKATPPKQALQMESESNIQQSADNVQQTADNVYQSADNVYQSGLNLRQSAGNIKPSAENVRQ